MRDILKLLRPSHYVKNLFIYLPLFFAGHITNYVSLLKTTVAFIAFCATASGIYILNDIRDIEEDRLHPRKRLRPITAGRVSRPVARALLIVLLCSGLAVSYAVNRDTFLLFLLYAALNVAYTVRLKQIAILDISIIACGFVIRIFIGGKATDTNISTWIVLMTFLLALFLALGKRRDDVLIYDETERQPRKATAGYNLLFIDSSMIIMAAVTIVSYIMYTKSPEIIEKFRTGNLYLTTIFVILGIMRWMQITLVEKKSGSPTEFILRDRFAQLTIGGWLIAFGLIIYWS